MAAVLIWRPWGPARQGTRDRGRGASGKRSTVAAHDGRWRWRGVLVVLVAFGGLCRLAAAPYPYVSVLMIDIMIAVLFAASLHFRDGSRRHGLVRSRRLLRTRRLWRRAVC